MRAPLRIVLHFEALDPNDDPRIISELKLAITEIAVSRGQAEPSPEIPGPVSDLAREQFETEALSELTAHIEKCRSEDRRTVALTPDAKNAAIGHAKSMLKEFLDTARKEGWKVVLWEAIRAIYRELT